MGPSVKYKKEKVKTSNEDVSVFLVDDDPYYLHLLNAKLNKYPHTRFHCYPSGEACLRDMHLNPRIVILDYYLDPGSMNGLETLKQIKRVNPDTEVIILSSQETLQVAADSLRMGAYAYVIKDNQVFVSIERLMETLFKGGQKKND